jgi:hypothetical protein
MEGRAKIRGGDIVRPAVPAEDMMQAFAYHHLVAAIFADRFQGALDWPWVTVVADVCRDDLLFEVEVTAARPL